MSRSLPVLLLAAAVMLGTSGCSTATKAPVPADTTQVTQEAPLGSRIKRRSNAAPTVGSGREDVEKARVQQGAVAVGIANRGGD